MIISAEHLPGSENVLADKASRIFDMNTEWSLDSVVYDLLITKFGKFDIDLFASRINTKHVIYASWKPDPNAKIIDAFLADWSSHHFYAFPPFSMILRTITKIQLDRATGVLICPLWPTQPWYPKLMKMLIDLPLLLPLNVLSLPFNKSHPHRQKKTLRLIACHLSGNYSKAEDFQMNQLLSCVPHGAPILLNST